MEAGLAELRSTYADLGMPLGEEWAALQSLKERLAPQHQVARRQQLHLQLDAALRREDPEAVADLRVRLRELETGD